MQHLTPVGLSQDGSELILVGESGEEFGVPVDHRFRSALRGDNARPGQLEMKMASALRPRDIQARIRAGESTEDVAAAAQTTVEAIMPFAGPVLAERAHVAQTALKASIRRRTNETTPGARTLDEASRIHLTTIGVRADDVTWDAWRREDGRWTLVAGYVLRGTEYRAVFTYDQPGRYVVADDEGARLLTGESTSAAAASEDPAPRRLSAVPTDPDELPLGDDAIELVTGAPPAAPESAPESAPEPAPEPDPVAEEPTAERTADLSATARAVREAADPAPTFDDLAADHADADWIASGPTTGSAPASTPAPGETAAAPPPPEPDDEEPVDEAPVEDEAPEPVAQEKPKKKGRSSVPSWDEIMFGGSTGRD